MGGFEGKHPGAGSAPRAAGVAHPSPGKRTLVEQVSSPHVQRKGAPHAAHDASTSAAQSHENSTSPTIHEIAAAGASGPSGSLPFADRIQRSFGRHDVSAIRSHQDSAATEANAAMGSTAYAHGSHVAFRGAPDLHTAAHEAAHVVQQRAGVQLKGGVGEAGDAYERHADAVADTVVAGGSAEALLSTMAGAPSGVRAAEHAVQHAVQFIGTPLNQTPPADEPKPAFGEDKGVQRRFSPEQYIAMWEKEQGRKMTPDERATINRGCIGITAANLHGGGNPLDSAVKTYATFELAHKYMADHNKLLDAAAKQPGSTVGPARYVVFAQLFWSNQSDNYDDRLHPDDKAFRPDRKTGEIDMSSYKYHAQSRIKKDAVTGADIRTSYVNFDYGFWDEASNSFWHANHMQYKDAARAAADPMKVLQSTREKFVKGYIDFDRIVFGVALAQNYNPGVAAIAHAGPH